MKYWLIHSNCDLSSYAVKSLYDEYYIVTEDTLYYLKKLGIPFVTLDQVNKEDIPHFKQRDLETNLWYNDTFTIFHFPKIKLLSQTKKVYRFGYKKYEIIVFKELCDLDVDDIVK